MYIINSCECVYMYIHVYTLYKMIAASGLWSIHEWLSSDRARGA